MKHNDKASQSESSARLDSLLSDFLNKEIDEPVELPGRQATSLPLGDLCADGARVASESQPELRAPTATQKVIPVNRTEVWEATPKLARPTESSGLTNLAVAELEKDVDSILGASAAATRKKLIFGSIVCILLLLAGRSIWQSRETADAQPISDDREVVVLSSDVDPPASDQTLSTTTTVPEILSATSGATAAPSSNRTHDGHSSVPLVVPDSPAGTDTASSIRRFSQSAASNAAKLQQMPAPALSHSNLTLSTLQDLPSVEPVLPPAPLPLPPGPIDAPVKNVIPDSTQTTAAIPPLLVKKVRPIYPDLARRMNVAGTVHVAIVVDTAGKVVSAEATDGPAVLRGAAELAVKQWRFRPSTMNGIPVAGKGTVSVLFSPNPR